MERDILLLGDPRLYEVSEEVRHEELEEQRPELTNTVTIDPFIRKMV